MLIVITGPSGVGKTTIIRRLLKADAGLKYSVSLTTRKPRYNERDGIDYKFISHEEFQKAIDNGEFVEWSEVYGEYYGRLKRDLEGLMRKNDAVIGIDVQGAKKLQEKYPKEVFIFLLPRSKEALESQLRGRRTEDDAALRRRLDEAIKEIQQAEKFKYNVVNNRINDTVKEVQSILIEERKNRMSINPC